MVVGGRTGEDAAGAPVGGDTEAEGVVVRGWTEGEGVVVGG